MKNNLITLILLIMTQQLTAQEFATNMKFESKFFQSENGKMHYIDEGTGDPILFLHGVPMQLFAWRNIIPGLIPNNRCIALDFMGFGKSDKPDIDYSFTDQINYLDQFIKDLDLQNLTLVMTDIGAVIGTYVASKYPDRIKSLVYFESPMGDARSFHKNGGMMQHMLFGMANKEKMGRKMFIKKNMMFKMFSKMMYRKLSPTEVAAYQEPFLNEKDRLPLFTLPNAFPKKGKNSQEGDMGDYMNKNHEWLKNNPKPMLILRAKPGMLINKKAAKWIQENYSCEMRMIGKGKHLIEEDLPFEIAEEILKWQLQLSSDEK